MTYSSRIAAPKSSNEPISGSDHTLRWPPPSRAKRFSSHVVAPNTWGPSTLPLALLSSRHSALVSMVGSEQEASVPMKSCMPNMAKTSWMARMTPKTLLTAGIALKSEVMISFMPALRATRRSGRRMRATRSTRSGRSSGTASARRTRMEMRTMVKSRTFQGE